MEPAIGGLYLSGGLSSYQRIADSETYQYPLGNFVPNLLLQTDLPDLAAAIAPRRIVIAGAVDAAGAKLPESEVRAEYRSAANVVVQSDASWTAKAILP